MLNHEAQIHLDPPFAGQPVAVQTEYCLNLRHKDAGCAHCVTTCPVEAITLTGVQPHLDGDLCIRCGLCLHTCPTDVFTQPNTAEVTLVQRVQPLSAHPIALVCALHPTPQTTTAPVATIVQHRRCLAALSVVQLLMLSDDGARALWIDDSLCRACPLGQTHAVLQRTVAAATQLLETFGRPPTIFCQSAQAVQDPTGQPQADPHECTLLDGGNPPISRRGFFGALGRAIRAQRVPDKAEPDPETTRPRPGQDRRGHLHRRLPHRLPPARRRLQQYLAQLTAPAAALVEVTTLPFADVQVDETACSACSLCACFCPTGALTFDEEDHAFTLHFQAASCIDCGICAVACPEDAVGFGDSLPAAALVVDEWAPLVAGLLVTCRQCGAPTAEQPEALEAARCYACRQGAGIVQPLQDGAGLMADLLQRLPKVENGLG